MIPAIGFLILSIVGWYLMWRIPTANTSQRVPSTIWERISIVIPARNEEHRIAPLLRSIQDQKLPIGEVLVVDDESTDRTADIARSLGATVQPSSPLPSGWRGKSWASHQGAQAAKGDILVFLDADTSLEPGGLERLLATFLQDKTPLSVQPYHRMQRPYEQLSILFNTVVMMSSNQYTPLGRRLRPRVFYGPCQILTKQDYDTIGGHEQVRSTVLEDIAIGKRFLEEGIPIRSIAGRDSISFRMYPDGVFDIVQGWSKNFATGAASIGVFNTILVSLWLTGMIGIGILSWFYLGSLTWIYAGLYLLYGIQLYWIGRRIGSFSIGLIPLHPMVGIFFTLVFLNSIQHTVFRRKVQWKGRDIPTKEDA